MKSGNMTGPGARTQVNWEVIMSSRISPENKKRLRSLLMEFGVRIERSIDGFKVLGLGNNTEPRADSLDSAIEVAEKECHRIYAKYL